MQDVPKPEEPLRKQEAGAGPRSGGDTGGGALRFAKLRICLAAGLVWLAGCAPEAGPPKPADLLAPREMVPLLADLHVAEGRAQHSARAADTIQALYLQQEAAIFWKRGVDRARFERSYRYYAAHPEELEAIYATLTDTLAMREVRLKAKAR